MTGCFLAVEGIDGAGKSTAAALLASKLAGEAPLVVDRHTAPGIAGGYAGRHLAGLANLIWGYPRDARTSELGFGHWSHLLAAWFHAVDTTVVRPALAQDRYVIADSWYHKFAARFALRVGVPRALSLFAGVSAPGRVLWLDIEPEVCAGRRRAPRATEQGEWQGLDAAGDGYVRYQRQVRSVYQALAAAGGWQVLTEVDDERLDRELRADLEGAR